MQQLMISYICVCQVEMSAVGLYGAFLLHWEIFIKINGHIVSEINILKSVDLTGENVCIAEISFMEKKPHNMAMIWQTT